VSGRAGKISTIAATRRAATAPDRCISRGNTAESTRGRGGEEKSAFYRDLYRLHPGFSARA